MFTDNERKTIGIIGAMKSEVDALKERIIDAQAITISGVEFVYGQFGNVNVVAAMSGIGKVFAAICAQTMILTFKPELVINIGVGGALQSGLNIADAAIAESVVQHDMDTTPIGDPLGLISGINIVNIPCSADFVDRMEKCAKELGINFKRGVIASGDCFVNDKAKKQSIVDNFNAIVCEMEGASVGHVCYVNKVEFGVLRTISDNGDENSGNDYFDSLEKASNAALEITYAFLKTF